MKKVKKAVIPAAGLGTRFFPATKNVPKEMLPIIDKPAILYVIEEAVQAGIEDIILIQGRGKTAIEDFFDINYELEDKLVKDGKAHLIDELNHIRNNVNIISIRQKQALGLGHAVYCSKSVVGEEPFAVLLGDEITYSESKENNPTYRLIQNFERSGISSVAVIKTTLDNVHKYGVIAFQGEFKNPVSVTDLVEKPKRELAPSLYALPGRYCFSANIFDYLRNAKAGVNGEIQLTDSMIELAKGEGLEAMTIDALRFDVGDKVGFLRANIEFALKHPEIHEEMKAIIKSFQIKI